MTKQPLPLFRVRASGLFNIMTDPKKKGELLSEGAKTYLEKCAKQLFYDYDPEKGSKETEKGIVVEDDSIELYNSVFFASHKKNSRRINADFLTGECDIEAEEETIDVKSSWSLDTFPASSRAADKKEYEWQGRAYMHLYNKPRHRVAFCLVDTPDHLIRFEPEHLHIVSHMPPELRVTRVMYERDMELEEKMLERCKAAVEYVREELFRIEAEHKGI
ncbi:MAG: hypothetical protein WBC18_20485 [Ottowia sp.]|uniref:hypothetical protein n=1 Tax=Ottowia sp. TaxID=1898956 RepID=UPI003C752BBE